MDILKACAQAPIVLGICFYVGLLSMLLLSLGFGVFYVKTMCLL